MGKTDLVIPHSFLCSNNCKQVFKTHKQLHCMAVYETALLCKYRLDTSTGFYEVLTTAAVNIIIVVKQCYW